MKVQERSLRQTTRLPDRSVSLMQLALIVRAMTGLETSSMNAVRWIKAIRQSPVTSITDTENTAMKTENTQEVLLIFMPHWNRRGTERRKRITETLLWD